MIAEMLGLKVTRVIRANRERVFDAWTKPEIMQKWFAPGPMTVSSASSDLRVGGTYSVAMVGSSGNEDCKNSTATGTYLEIIPNEKLRFSWPAHHDPAAETMVTVELKDVEGGTEVTISHDGFPNQGLRDRHELGWIGCLDKLEEISF